MRPRGTTRIAKSLDRAAKVISPNAIDYDGTLHYGDNLHVLRKNIVTESIDLIYLDPPFKSNRDYNILFREPDGTESPAQVKVFTDTWHWNQTAQDTFDEILQRCPAAVCDVVNALVSSLGHNDVTAYIVMMTIRLQELHRVLKPTGSIYLHCDPSASHYLKLIMDAVFGKTNFRNEIIWHYRKWPSGHKQFQRNHDVIFFYSKSNSEERVFNKSYMERTASTLKRFGKSRIISGHDEEGNRLPSATAEEESEGVPRDDVWDIGRVPPIKQLFPTEKPRPLLERIIEASTNKGMVVLDPFCGCGTTIVEAHRLGRKWIGIDVTPLAISLIKYRLTDMFGKVNFREEGSPIDVAGAKALAAQDRHKFEWWAVGQVPAKPAGDQKKGADAGVDGVCYFRDDKSNKGKKIVVQVKSGIVHVKDIRELAQVRKKQGAELGFFISLEPATREMLKEAVSEGKYSSPLWHRDYPRIQIRTVEELLQGKSFESPPTLRIHKKADAISESFQSLPLGAEEIDFDEELEDAQE